MIFSITKKKRSEVNIGFVLQDINDNACFNLLTIFVVPLTIVARLITIIIYNHATIYDWIVDASQLKMC